MIPHGPYHFQPFDSRYEPLIAIVFCYGESKAHFFTMQGDVPSCERWHMWEALSIPVDVALEFGEFIPLEPRREFNTGVGRQSWSNGLPALLKRGDYGIFSSRTNDKHVNGRNGKRHPADAVLCNGVQHPGGKRSKQRADESSDFSAAATLDSAAISDPASGESGPGPSFGSGV